MKLFIDPGHRNNAFDFGATANGLKESELNLKTAKALGKMLSNHEVAYSRESEEETISIYERVERANAMQCELFISIHHNAAASNDATGIEVLYRSDAQKELAATISSTMANLLNQKDRGAKHRSDVYILNQFENAILVECGFITNPKDALQIKSDRYSSICAKAIFDCINTEPSKKVIASINNTTITKNNTSLIKRISNLFGFE